MSPKQRRRLAFAIALVVAGAGATALILSALKDNVLYFYSPSDVATKHIEPGVAFRTQEGWTIAEDQAELTFWSFPPPDHPAYPSAVKRRLVRNGAGLDLEMNVACEAPKTACDDLVRTFEARNRQMIEAMRAKR